MKTVLIVEDNALVMELLGQLLEERYEVHTAVNGKLGVEAARLLPPDIILMDLTMPVMDGWTAIRILRGDSKTAGIPVIALSARVDDGDVQRALAAGANAHLAKPIDDVALISEMERLLLPPRATTGQQLTRSEVAGLIQGRKKQG